MKSPTPRGQSGDEIVFSRGLSPIAVFFTAVPVLTLFAVLLAILNNRFPLPLQMLLAGVMGSCLAWIKVALPQVGDVTVTLTPQELRIGRMIGAATYPWSSIESVKLVDPGPTLADAGRSEEGRIGIGIFLRSDKPRHPEAPPDEIIITGTQSTAEPIIKGCERIAGFLKRGGGGSAGGFGRTAKGFRKTAKAA